jgi:glycosyltransferase involved in cell wall biosynthesis
LTELLSAAVSDERFSRVLIFSLPREEREFELPQSSKVEEIPCPFAGRNRFYRWWWLENRLSAALRAQGADIFLSMSGAGIAEPAAPQITYIQQSLPFATSVFGHFDLHQRLRMKAMYLAMRRSCQASRFVIVQTQTMRKTIMNAFGIEPAKITVSCPTVGAFKPPSVPSPSLESMRQSQPGCRALYVGNDAKYKNLGVLFKAVEKLRENFPAFSLFLTLRPDHPASQTPGISCLGYLNREQLSEAYSLADFVVMPSLQETVGLPMLEAMSAGAPVIAADRPYAREVCRDAAVFFDPFSSASLISTIEMLMRNPGLRSGLIARGIVVTSELRSEPPCKKLLDLASVVALRHPTHA